MTTNYNIFFGGGFFKKGDENPSEVEGVELEIDVNLPNSIEKKDYEAQLERIAYTIKENHIEILEACIDELKEQRFDFSLYEEAQWIVISVENGNKKEIYERDRDEGSKKADFFDFPLVLKL